MSVRQRRAPAAVALAAAVVLVPAAWASPEQDYMLYCQGCHGDQAQGVPGKVPPLAGSIALFMRSTEGRDYLLRVPGAANSALPDVRLAAVLNWLAEHFPPVGGAVLNTVAPFTEAEVRESRRTPLANVKQRRGEVVRSLAASGPAPPPEY